MALNFAAAFVGIVVIWIILWIFSSERRIASVPSGPIRLGMGETAKVRFTLERRSARSLIWQVSPDLGLTLANSGNCYSITGPATLNTSGGSISVTIQGVVPGTSTLSVSAAAGRAGRDFGPLRVTVVVHPGYDYAGHPHPEWRWEPLTGATGYYELTSSDDKSYECTEYVYSKATWNNSGRRPPKWCIEGLGCGIVQRENIEEKLRADGYDDTDGQGRAFDQTRCARGAKQNRNCVVLYLDEQSDTVIHAAVFDPRLRDWGCKRSSGGPIVRFKNPRDLIFTYEAAQRPLTRMVFLCKDGPGPDYISDRDLHRWAASCE